LLREPSGDGGMDVMHSVAMNRSSGLRDRFARESNAASDEAVRTLRSMMGMAKLAERGGQAQ
jgi:hypothetical protein